MQVEGSASQRSWVVIVVAVFVATLVVIVVVVAVCPGHHTASTYLNILVVSCSAFTDPKT